MSLRRKVVISLAALLLLLLLGLALAPLLLRGRIEARVKRAIADNVNARADWRDLDVGLLRTFPNFSLQLEDLLITGVGVFDGDTLVLVPRFRLVLDLGSVLGSLRGNEAVVVRTIELQRPQAHLQVRPDGVANWDIMKERASDAERTGRGMAISLKRLDIDDGLVTLDNQQSDVRSRVAGLDHSLSGDFGKQRFTVNTRTTADSASLSFAGLPYLSNARIESDVQLDADRATHTFTLRDNRIRINELMVNATGTAVTSDDDVALDLSFHAPRTEFREILSLVPAVFTQDFQNVQTTGSMAVQGRVRGRLGPHSFPAFAVQAAVENGSFRYPDLPLPARDIFFQLRLTNPGGDVDSTVVNVERFHVVIGSDPVDGSLVVRTPRSDPLVALRLAGKLDLANLPRTVKLPDVQQLSGIVTANAAMRARLSDVDQKRYDRVSARGTIEVRRLALAAADLRQPLSIHQAALELTPEHARLTDFRGRAGSSDLAMTGSLENVLGFMLGRQDLRGAVSVASTRFDLNEWRSDDAIKSVVVPGHIDFTVRASADTVKYGSLSLRDTRGVLQIKDQRVTLQDLRTNVLGGALNVKGYYETRPGARPAFDLAVDMNQVSPKAAFAEMRTVQAFAPVARYADGSVDAQIKLTGELGTNMLPVLENLSGLGSLLTSNIALRDFPPLDRLADALKVQQLQNPGFVDLKSSFAIDKGRLHVKPFDVNVGQIGMTVSGSNGIDQSLDYTLAVRLPRAVLGTEANQAISTIINRSQQAGFDLQSAESITLAARIGGTITRPTVTTSFRDAAGDAGAGVAAALRAAAERRQEAVVARVDSAAEAAKLRLLAEADSQAAAIRAEAGALAEKLRREGYARADSLEARASGLAKIAAKAAADRLRRETDSKADAIVREADARALQITTEARRRQ